MARPCVPDKRSRYSTPSSSRDCCIALWRAAISQYPMLALLNSQVGCKWKCSIEALVGCLKLPIPHRFKSETIRTRSLTFGRL
ncbi:hypothetical protein SCLCIDRAFT_643691 [Scleroderma citrinum Foug A]|uniref:Uncharacterized protein n=1 Tax=Scleroderma citrinum Foug A TaxID=1036808 RepID=A0A0C2ZRZ7_9AGAM|nr:hypothetical protein SCLCIDRAFT_643691 [Scleroderma citrinum Foug A]